MSDNHNWTDVAKNLPKGRTVLVLGPDAIPYYPVGPSEDGEMSFSKLARQDIAQALNGQILHFYERDNLFLFPNARAKRDAMDAMEACIQRRDWLPDAELLRKIVAIPFPLVLNLNPDKLAYEAFLKYYRAPQFDFFRSNTKAANSGSNARPTATTRPCSTTSAARCPTRWTPPCSTISTCSTS